MKSQMKTATICAIALWLQLTTACDTSSENPFLPPFEQCIAPPLSKLPAKAENGTFWSQDEEFIPHGVNSYPLLQHIGNNEYEYVSDILGQAASLGRPILRTNAFMDGGTNPARIRDDDGNIREEGLEALDHLVAMARKAGVVLVLVLTNNWEDYGGATAVVNAVAPGEGLPKDAFWSEPRAVDAQREYVQTIVTRTNSITGETYGTDATVFAWELANEARCDDLNWCSAKTLGDWAFEMSAAIRETGAVQPIYWGGAGYLGEHGEDLEDIGQRGGVDVLTFHLYLHYSHEHLQYLPDDERVDKAVALGITAISERLSLSRALGMPLVVEEFGWKPPSHVDKDAERAAVYEGWLALAHYEGIATMPWMIGETNREDYDGLLIRPDDKKTCETISCDAVQDLDI